MKKNYILILFSLFLYNAAFSQNCNFTALTNPGTTVVSFIPNQTFLQWNYHYIWSFGDGTGDSTNTPTHAYNGTGPFVACYDVYDSVNTWICNACDTINFAPPLLCSFTYTNTGTTFTFIASGASGPVSWDFGDGSVDTGQVVTHTYTSGGPFTVTMTEYNSSTHTITCQGMQYITVPGTSNCTFSYTASGNTAGFYVNNASAVQSVSWDFGDNTSGSGIQASHTYNSSGIFTVCATIIDTAGTTCTSCQVVGINVSNNCYFTYMPDTTMLSTYFFSAVPAYPTSNIVWDFGDGTTDTGPNPTHNFAAPGTYYVCMTEYNGSAIACQSCLYLTVHNPNNCNFTASANTFNPLTIDFQATGNTTVAWDFGDGTSDTGSTVSHTYLTAGFYYVCIGVGTPGTSNYCSYCNVVQVGNPTGICNISYYADPLNPNTFIFTSSSSSPGSMITWDFGDNTADIGQSVSHTYNSSGSFTVCVIERDSAQNTVCQSCITIYVNGATTLGCQATYLATSLGLDAYFVDMSSSQSPTMTYAWDFGDGGTSNLEFPQHHYTIPGLYNVCLTIADSGCTDTYCSAVLIDTVNFHGPGNGGCNAFYAFIQMSPFVVTVVNLSSGYNLTFDWDFGDGAHDNNPYPSHQYASTGSYNLCLTVADANGCTSTYCDTVSVDSLGHIFRVGTSGFTLNVVSPAQLTGVKEVTADQSFSIYPNPFNSEIRVAMLTGTKTPTDYRIFSIQGAEVSRGKLEGTNGVINTQTLSSGAYLLEVTMNDGSRGFQRVVKN